MFSSTGNISYSKLEAELIAAADWLASLKVKIPPTRFGQYRRVLRKLEDARLSGNNVYTSAGELNAFAALFESNELVVIHRGLKERGLDEYLRPKLEEIASGPESYVNEVSAGSNKARNTAFELAVFERLLAGGMTPATDVPVVDLAVRVRDRTVMVECNRPQSSAGVEKAIGSARDQLRCRYADFKNLDPIGLIAIDLTKVLNPDLEILMNYHPLQIASVLRNRADSFIFSQAAVWDRITDDRTAGVLLRQSALAWDEGRKTMSWIYWNSIMPLFQRSEAVIRLIQESLERTTRSEGTSWVR